MDHLPNQNGDGTHTFKQIQQLFEKRDLSYAQIKNIFTQADYNHDNVLSDMEWADFFAHVIDPFQKCDSDKSNVLGNDELKACLKDE